MSSLTRKEALAFLINGNEGLRCFSRYGSYTEDCAPVAYRLAANLEYHNGEPITEESLDYLMGLVVNGHDDVAYMLQEYRIPRVRKTNPLYT